MDNPDRKPRLLYILRYLNENTDELHPAALSDIIAMLSSNDITVTRQTLYKDIEQLQDFGYDIVRVKGNHTGYYVGSREFELPELRLLVDSIQSSKFITRKKTLQLIKKLESFTSVHNARQLNRQVFVSNRVKSMNESVYYNVDKISNAINADRKITFHYFEYTMDRKRSLRHGGKLYSVSPYALLCEDENYYLLAYDTEAGIIKHYRVDKMLDITQTDFFRDGRKVFAEVDMSSYTKSVFSMFSGEKKRVTMRMSKRLAGPVIDRFGTDVILVPEGDTDFKVILDVEVSPQFYSWVFSFGQDAQIVAPAEVVEEMRQRVRRASEIYG